MRTQKQIEASRRNGAKSGGPVSPMGKDISSRNAIKHGLFSRKHPPNPHGDRRFHRISRATRNHFQPGDPEARALTDALAYARWLKELVLLAMQDMAPASFGRLYAHYDRACFRAWDALGRAIRLRTPAPGQLPAGFFVRRAGCENKPEDSSGRKALPPNNPTRFQTPDCPENPRSGTIPPRKTYNGPEWPGPAGPHPQENHIDQESGPPHHPRRGFHRGPVLFHGRRKEND
jgi:hypothetical protein